MGIYAEGLFIDDADVANSPKQFGTYGAGDIRYRDLNGDNVITEADQAPIGYPTSPEIIYGFVRALVSTTGISHSSSKVPHVLLFPEL